MIRLAKSSDIPAIVSIYNEAIALGRTADTEPITAAQRKDWLEQHPADHYPVYVYESNQQVIAWLSLSAWRPGRQALYGVGEVSYYVQRKRIRKGVANQLMNYAVTQAPALGLQHFIAILLANNTPSIQLLKKYSFVEWGHFPGVAKFPDTTCDQVIYGKMLEVHT